MGNTCKKCQTEVTKKYCPDCGTPVALDRINGRYIITEIGSIFNFEKGFFYTIRELLLRPGRVIQIFIYEDRNRVVKPIIFVLICSLIYTAVQQLLHFEDSYVNAGGFGKSATTVIYAWIQQNYGYANLLMAFFIAFWIKILFRKYDFNYYEILILLYFVMGVGMLIYTVFGVIEGTAHIRVLDLGGLVGILYTSWAIGQFFDKSKKSSYLMGLVSYLLGMVTFFMGATILGLGIDLIQKML